MKIKRLIYIAFLLLIIVIMFSAPIAYIIFRLHYDIH